MGGRGGLEALDQLRMTLDRVKPGHLADPEKLWIKAKLSAQGLSTFRLGGREPDSVDPVAEGELARVGEAEGTQLVELLGGDGEDAGGEAIEQPPLEQAAPREVFFGEHAVLGVNEAGPAAAGQRAGDRHVDQSPEVVGVDQVAVARPQDPTQRPGGRHPEAQRFVERADGHLGSQPPGERAGTGEAADGDFEFRRVEPVADLYQDVFHPALVEAVHDLEESDLAFGGLGFRHRRQG